MENKIFEMEQIFAKKVRLLSLFSVENKIVEMESIFAKS